MIEALALNLLSGLFGSGHTSWAPDHFLLVLAGGFRSGEYSSGTWVTIPNDDAHWMQTHGTGGLATQEATRSQLDLDDLGLGGGDFGAEYIPGTDLNLAAWGPLALAALPPPSNVPWAGYTNVLPIDFGGLNANDVANWDDLGLQILLVLGGTIVPYPAGGGPGGYFQGLYPWVAYDLVVTVPPFVFPPSVGQVITVAPERLVFALDIR